MNAIESHRLQILRIASLFYRAKLNTREIAYQMSMTEAQVWNRMSSAHAMWAQAIEDYTKKRASA